MDLLCCLCCEAPLHRKGYGGLDKKYCGDACRERYKRRLRRYSMPVRSCRECGKALPVIDIGRSRTFCGDLCKRRFFVRKRNRRASPIMQAVSRRCGWCEAEFAPTRANAVYCSRPCYTHGNKERPPFIAEDRPCDACGTVFTARRHDARFCCVKCNKAFHSLRRARRCGPVTSEQDDYGDRDIFERDRWRCHLCKKAIDPKLSRMDPKGATIDHLVPLSLGGTDTAANVAAAHRKCNMTKSVKAVGEQLRLIA